MNVHAICKYIRILHKNISASPSKDVKTFFVKKLCCHIANYTIQLVTTGNTANSYLTSTVNRIRRGACISRFRILELRNRVTKSSYAKRRHTLSY